MTYRLYTPDELGPDGYPPEWHTTLKHDVRAQADHRCVRCHHPYRNGKHGNGEWSRCDGQCDHGGPARLRHGYELAPQFIAGDDKTFNAGRQVVYSQGSVCVDPASGRLLPPLALDAQWRILTVHHLDGDKANCRWWNLAALCQRCHLTIQGRVVMARVWPWEHSEWFRPYVAGYYAWTYLGVELTRAEVEERLDELLDLERAA
jgi:hypothetical protein